VARAGGGGAPAPPWAFFDPALLDLEVAIAKNVVYFHRNEYISQVPNLYLCLRNMYSTFMFLLGF
jgi:hypothetical protein